MEKRKRTIVVVLWIVIIVCPFLLLRGCMDAVLELFPDSVSRDWRYPISHGYQIDEFYYGNYQLTSTSGGDYHAEINANVISFFYNESYIGLQCTREEDIAQNEIPEDVIYYFVDMESGQKRGPFTEEGFYQFCNSNGIGTTSWQGKGANGEPGGGTLTLSQPFNRQMTCDCRLQTSC